MRKEEIDQIVSQMLPDREFAIDTTYAQGLTRKRRFRGDRGLLLSVPAETYDKIIRSVERVEDPGAPAFYRVTIHTERWEEVSQ